MMFVWLILFIVFVSIACYVFIDWFHNKAMGRYKPLKIAIISLIATGSFITLQACALIAFNPDYGKEYEKVTITEVDEVYKDASSDEFNTYYYISKKGANELCREKINKVFEGDSNYIITKEYTKFGTKNTEQELVVKNASKIKNFIK